MSKASGASEKKSGHGNLTLFIVGAIVAAVVLALVAPGWAVQLSVGGEVFLRLLQMVVVPLVMASVMSGILGLGDVRKLGRPGGYAVAYYLSTTVLAVITGLIIVNIIRPGDNIDPKLVEDARREGAREVEKARGGLASHSFTWKEGIFRHTQGEAEAAESDEMEVEDPHAYEVRLRIVQIGQASRPASAQLMVREEDEKEWRAAGEAFTAKTEKGQYERVLEIPDKTAAAKLVFTPQEGGTTSFLLAELTPGPPTITHILENLVLMLFTNNLLESMVEINLLPLIVFSIVFAGMLTTMGQRSQIIADFVISVNDALLNFILLLMKVAPIGIFCLVAARFGKAQMDGSIIELIRVQSYYMATVLIGLFLHALITLPLLLWIFTKRNPYVYLMQMSQAVLTAFSTASSTATLPVTMECAEMKAGVSRRSTEFVLPLGATINMDGTALYEAAGAIFIAQAYATVNPEFELTFLAQATIAVTATLAAIGAAGIPEAGLVTMLIVLNAVGLPIEMIGLILPVDWLLDRFRTAVNAFGDSVGAAIVDRSFESA